MLRLRLVRQAEGIGVEPGDVLAGKYRVERVLGAGGMGVVVQATHTVLEERVALKFLKPHVVEDAKVKARFLQEAQASVRIRSTHVARVLDVGELDSGAPYIVMEFLDGRDLESIFEQESNLDSLLACNWILQSCEALAVAHAAGIIHRDVKPANLFVTHAADGSSLVKVLDFGISKVMNALGGPAMDLTQTQTAMGSPPYMSPEQMRSTKSVDSRTDVWSLGVVLYRALAGRLPFQSESMPELCALVLDAEVPPLRDHAPEVSEELEQVVHRCLMLDPADRYQNVAALAEALAPYAGEGASERAARVRRILVAASTDANRLSVSLADSGRAEDATTGVTRRGTSPSIDNTVAASTGDPSPRRELAEGGATRAGTTSFGQILGPSRFRSASQPLVLVGGALVLIGVSVGIGMWIAGARAGDAKIPSADPVAEPSVSDAPSQAPGAKTHAAAALSSTTASAASAPQPSPEIQAPEIQAPEIQDMWSDTASQTPAVPRPMPPSPKPPPDPFGSRH